ncbi:MAG TPA: hypothetical protein VK956_05590, partial [Verrucomicrobium sp.]|nr:hypothetical protein [Verrucomicrobium sp.]
MNLTFWGWEAPVLEKAVAELQRGRQSGPLDLADTLIITPTAESVRRLREALAVAAGQRDSAVMAPHLWHPALAFQPRVRGANLVSPLQAQAAWTQVLLEAPLPEMSALFPVQPEQQDLAWASAVAQTLGTVKTTLGAGGYTLASAAEVLAELDDPLRWQNLATLE